MYTIGGHFNEEFKQLIKDTPETLLKLNGIAEIDPFILANKYYNVENIADMSVDPNANIGSKSPVNFQSEIFKPILRLRSLSILWEEVAELYDKETSIECMNACLTGKLYFHDLVKLDIPYCFATDTSHWMLEGRPYGWLPGGQPKKLQSFIGQTVEVAMDLSQEHAGAIGLSNVLVNASFYSYYDRIQIKRSVNHLDRLIPMDTPNRHEEITNIIVGFFAHSDEDFFKKKEKVKHLDNFIDIAMFLYDKLAEDLLQHLVHVLHNTFRVGGDSPFTNLSLFCRETIKTAFAEAIFPDWTTPLDIIEEIMHTQEVFMRFFSEGSPITGKNYRFPVTTVNIATKSREVPNGEEFDPEKHFTEEEKALYPNKKYIVKDEEFFKLVTKYNAKRGVFNFHRGEKLASCCRLTQSLSDLRDKFRFDTFGNGGMSLGSHRVVAMNLHAIACEAIARNLPFSVVLNKYQALAEILLVAHKSWLKKIIKTGTLKFFNIDWENLNMFFSTFGFTGLWDAYSVMNTDIEYEDFAKNVIQMMEKNAQIATDSYDDFVFNVEEIPAENASPKLAQMDNFIYKDCDWYEEIPLLSNQMIPLYVEYDMFDRIEIMGKLMDDVSGGAIGHFNVDGSMTEESSYKLTKLLVEVYGLVHFAMEIGTTTCVNGHTSIGVRHICPVCKGEIETWTRRIVGYASDTKDWVAVRRDWENFRRGIYSIED